MSILNWSYPNAWELPNFASKGTLVRISVHFPPESYISICNKQYPAATNMMIGKENQSFSFVTAF